MDKGAWRAAVPPGVTKNRPGRSDSVWYKKVITQLMIGIDKALCCWSVCACVCESV